MKNIKSYVCTTANQLVKDGYTRSEAFVTAKDNSVVIAPKKVEIKVTLADKVKSYKKLQATIEELEAQASAIKEEIISEMEAQQTEEIKVDIFKVRYITVISNRFNTTEFKQTHSDLYKEFLKESVCKRFTVA